MTRIQTTIIAMLIMLGTTLAGPVVAQTAAAPPQTAAPQTAQPPAVTERDLLELRHQYELLKKDFDRLDGQSGRDLGAQNDRITDLHAKANWFAILTAIFAILIAISAGISFAFGTKRAVVESIKEAKVWLMEDAKAEAKQFSDTLVADSRTEIEKHIVELEHELQRKIDEHVTTAKDHFDAMTAEIEGRHREAQDALKRIQEAIQNGDVSGIPEAEKEAVRQGSKDAEAKPEPERTYSDWEFRAIEASLEGDYPASAHAYDRAAQAADATQEQVAGALFGKGWALGEGGHTEKELVAYDAVVRRFGDAEAPELSILVAKALFNKGVTYHEADNLTAQIAVYDEVIQRFGGTNIPELRETVASTLNGLGDVRRKQAKALWQDPSKASEAKELLTLSLADLDQALDSGFDNVVQHAAGNKAYAMFLLEYDEAAVVELLRQALKGGGQKMFDLLLEDIAKHRLPQDDAYHALLVRIWAEVQAEPGDV